MSTRDNIERIIKSLEDLKEKNRTIPIVVEGKNDVMALRRLLFEGEILPLHSRMTIERFSKKLSGEYKEVILLLDWDSKGKRLTASLIKHLNSYGVKADYDFWKLCFSMVSQMSNVESLPSAFYRVTSESGVYPHT